MKDPKELEITRQTKALTTSIQWANSPFESVASVCNFDGSKLPSQKSTFKKELIKHFHGSSCQDNIKVHKETNKNMRSRATTDNQVPNLSEEKQESRSTILTECPDEWLNDIMLANVLTLLRTQYPNALCKFLYPMPISAMKQIFTSKNSRVLNEVDYGKIIPLNTGHHWVTIIFDSPKKTIHYVDSLGAKIRPDVRNIITNRFQEWIIDDFRQRLQTDGYQCGIWVFVIAQLYLSHLCALNGESQVR